MLAERPYAGLTRSLRRGAPDTIYFATSSRAWSSSKGVNPGGKGYLHAFVHETRQKDLDIQHLEILIRKDV